MSVSEQAGFLANHRPFLEWLVVWKRDLPTIRWADLARDVPAGCSGLFCVDMVNGFCHEGNLASPRVHALIPAIVRLFRDAYKAGVRQFVLPQDTHRHDAVEFYDFPLHCVEGTSESEMIPELQELPFADLFQIVPKNSLSASHETTLDSWLEKHPDLNLAIMAGNCTDLCVHQLTMHLKLRANARNLPMRVIVPENCVQTYDLPVQAARELGVLPHDGDFLHLVFLYHLRLNGAEVVRAIE